MSPHGGRVGWQEQDAFVVWTTHNFENARNTSSGSSRPDLFFTIYRLLQVNEGGFHNSHDFLLPSGGPPDGDRDVMTGSELVLPAKDRNIRSAALSNLDYASLTILPGDFMRVPIFL